MMKPIYLDYAATTPVDARVAEKMQQCLTSTGTFGNPASGHCFGLSAKTAVENARAQVAELISAAHDEIIFTSGATESNNLALKGAAQLYQRKGKHIITTKTEHKSVLDCCAELEKAGFQVTYLATANNGLIDMEQFKNALRPDTILVSVMQVNNETGVIQDIAAIALVTAARDILLHVDAAQSAGKIPIDVKKHPIDLLSLCAHKVYGPKGIGALYVRKKPRVKVAAQIHGGGQEQGMRSGTLATHQIVGMGEAFYLAKQQMEHDSESIRRLRDQFLEKITRTKKVLVNGDLQYTVPHIVNLQFENHLADQLLKKLSFIAASTASACQGKGVEPSYVLRAMGLSEFAAKCSVRFSFGRFTTEEDIEQAAKEISSIF